MWILTAASVNALTRTLLSSCCHRTVIVLSSCALQELEAAARRGEVGVAHAREKWKIEREQWQQQIRLKLEKELRSKEAEMEARLRSERDQELEAIITRLQDEQRAERMAEQTQHAKQSEQRDRQHAEEVKGRTCIHV